MEHGAATTERQTYTVEEAARLLGIGRNTAYQAVAEGQIPHIRIKGRIVVPRAAIERMLAGEHQPPAAA